jgi:hypothetical protein
VNGGALETEWRGERGAMARADRRAFLIIAALLTLAAIVQSLSVQADHARMGHPDAFAAWTQEVSSIVSLLILTPALIWVSRLLPVAGEAWRRTWPLYLLLTLPWSAAHVTLMVVFRKIVFALNGQNYGFDPLAAGLYEYRKDLFGFVIIAGVILASREIEAWRQEAEAAREDARRGKRLTLKCGGRTIWIDAADFVAAHAAGNYVEARTTTGQHLARITLAALQRQLAEAGVNAARVHRSWLVNRDRIAEAVPNGSGDLTLRMTDGGEVPASRRFRGAIGS